VAWHSLSNIAYLLKSGARGYLEGVLQYLSVPATGTAAAHAAFALPMSDIEDALQVAAAQTFNADFIVTRNLTDFASSPIPPLSPAEFLQKIATPP
jgi:hypothetical protein